MLKYIFIGNFRVPTYSLFVIMGVVLCNCIAQLRLKKNNINPRHFFLIELFGGIGSIIGAKLLAIYEYSSGTINLEVLKEAGYSYYGGLLGFFLFTRILCRLCKINSEFIAYRCIFLIPMLHAFWKVSCFMGGCCFGIKYSGPFSVVYPDGVNKLSGYNVLPTQIIEAVCSLLIAFTLHVLSEREVKYEPVGVYCVMYGIFRFFIEFIRYSEHVKFLSDGQIYSIICVMSGILMISLRIRSEKANHE